MAIDPEGTAQDQARRRHAAVEYLLWWDAAKDAPETLMLPISERRSLRARAAEVKAEYFRSLPLIPISRCPYDLNLVRKRMDPFGIDGLWWQVWGPDDAPTGDPHVTAYRGAMPDAEAFVAGAPPGSQIHIGPEVPYVIPRLLEMPGVACVITQVPLLTGVYIMTYFADPVLPGAESTQSWLRETYYYESQPGFQTWNAKSEQLDFDLSRWIDRDEGNIYWVEPGDQSLTLRRGKPNECPFVDLPGSREMRLLTSSGVTKAPPTANAEDLFD